MKKTLTRRSLILVAVLTALTLLFLCSALMAAAEGTDAAAETQTDASSEKSSKAIAAGIAVGIAAAAGAIGMAVAIGKSAESMARQPEAAQKINSAMMLGLVFIETAIIYALIVAILIIFVL